MSPIQGVECLVEAMNQYRHIMKGCGRLVLVGDGPLRQTVEKMIIRYRLENVVHCVGKVPHSDVNWWIGAATVCVGSFPPERGDKGTISALKVKGYLACGRPVITTDMDEMAMTIAAAGAGISVQAGDPGSMAKGIEMIVTENLTKWEKRCDAAEALIDKRSEWTAEIARLVSKLGGFWKAEIV
jgi:glycosyltransferase involved in cell wall biosynthesis